MPDRCALWTRGALALGLALIARASLGASLDFCHGPSEPGAAAQDRLIQVAALVKAELDQSGAQMALVSRSGLALQRLDQRYSHAGVSLKASDNAPWSVRQLYYACDEQRPRLFDQGMSGFVMGANDPDEGYLSIVLLPDAAAAPIERATRDDQQALKLLGDTYSANAFAFSTRYQNCNQWLAELMAGAWAPAADAGENRARAQQALMQAGYTPTVLDVGWQPLVWLAGQIRWLHTDDHPADGGFRPAFNAQLAVDAATQLIAAVDVVNSGSDMNQMVPMHAQLQRRYEITPAHWLADGGFTKLPAIEHLAEQGTAPMLPLPKSRNPNIDPYEPKSTDSEHLAAWRQRMASPEGKLLYTRRGAMVECANAQLRRRGLLREVRRRSNGILKSLVQLQVSCCRCIFSAVENWGKEEG